MATYSNYSACRSDKQVSRKEAVRVFKSEGYFRYVYKELKDKLLDGILLNSFNRLSKIQLAHFRIQKRSLESKMLIQSGGQINGHKNSGRNLC